MLLGGLFLVATTLIPLPPVGLILERDGTVSGTPYRRFRIKSREKRRDHLQRCVPLPTLGSRRLETPKGVPRDHVCRKSVDWREPLRRMPGFPMPPTGQRGSEGWVGVRGTVLSARHATTPCKCLRMTLSASHATRVGSTERPLPSAHLGFRERSSGISG